MRLAIQEDMLPGATLLDRFHLARDLGFEGVELWGRDLTPRAPEIAAALARTGLVVSAVNHGRQGDLLAPDRAEREAALAELRQSIVNAVDLGAAGVIVVPHFGAPSLPDLTPYKSTAQLEFELLHNHLRTLSDYVYALGTSLYLEPVNPYETQFLTTLADAVRVRRRIKDHPHVLIAADLFHMALAEADLYGALREHAADIGYVHLADSNRRLPGQGLTDFAAASAALRQGGYAGWAALACGQPGHNQPAARQFGQELPAALALLRQTGWTAV